MKRRLFLAFPVALFARQRKGRGAATGRTGVSRRSAEDQGSVFDRRGDALKDQFPGLDPVPNSELDQWYKKLQEYRGYTDTLSAEEFYALTLWAYQRKLSLDDVFREMEANKINAGYVFKKLNTDPQMTFKQAKKVLITELQPGNPSPSPPPSAAGIPSSDSVPR